MPHLKVHSTPYLIFVSIFYSFCRSIPFRWPQRYFHHPKIVATTILSATMSQSENITAQEVAKLEMASEVPKLIGALVTCFCIAWLAVILRIVSRRMKRTALKIDDCLLITSLVCSDLPFRCRTDGSLWFRPSPQQCSV